jgi:hypothetical protein
MNKLLNPIRVQLSPLTLRIYAGRVNKAGDTWSGEKFDVTSDVFGAVIEMVRPGNKTTVTRQDGKQFEVEVREVASQGVDRKGAGDE